MARYGRLLTDAQWEKILDRETNLALIDQFIDEIAGART